MDTQTAVAAVLCWPWSLVAILPATTQGLCCSFLTGAFTQQPHPFTFLLGILQPLVAATSLPLSISAETCNRSSHI